MRFRLIADFEFDAPHAEGAALALAEYFASLATSGESSLSPQGRFLIECTDPAWIAAKSREALAETRRAREEIRARMMRDPI